jgi:hypothetical protein
MTVRIRQELGQLLATPVSAADHIRVAAGLERQEVQQVGRLIIRNGDRRSVKKSGAATDSILLSWDSSASEGCH